MTEPKLPAEVTLDGPAGEGRRSVVYRGRFGGRLVAVKVYRKAFIEKYRDRHGIDIARFEMERNRAVRRAPGLRRFTAEPLAILGGDDGHDLAFVQEFIEGIPLVELGQRERGLPESVLEAGRTILAGAEAAGLFDLDLYYRNILLRRDDDSWIPVLHDFNLLPQHLFPPNPFLALAYLLGLRKKSHRDRRCIAQWKRFSQACREGRPFRA